MKVINQISVIIEIAGNQIKPGESYNIPRTMVTEIDIHSNVGGCYIKWEGLEKQPKVRCYGKMGIRITSGKEDDEKNIYITLPSEKKQPQ